MFGGVGLDSASSGLDV